jgi:hypothetical protein
MAVQTAMSMLRLENRIPVTASSLPYTLLPGVLLYTLACLSRTPNTYFLRLFLFPIFLLICLHVALGYIVVGGPYLANLSVSNFSIIPREARES